MEQTFHIICMTGIPSQDMHTAGIRLDQDRYLPTMSTITVITGQILMTACKYD